MGVQFVGFSNLRDCLVIVVVVVVVGMEIILVEGGDRLGIAREKCVKYVGGKGIYHLLVEGNQMEVL